jgi:predicted protein tyrosine phosphatase
MVPYKKDMGNYILSLINPETNMQQIHKNHRILHFHDTITIRPGYKEPSEFHVREIIRFVKDVADNINVLVHCHAGISRSPAAAIIMLMEKGLTATEAFTETKRIRPHMDPNPLMLEHYGLIVDKLESIRAAYQLFRDAKRIEDLKPKGKVIV